MMKPLTSEEVRDRIAKAPPAERAALVEIAWSCHDGGISAGLAGMARITNPYEQLLPSAEQVVAKGKARK